MVCLRGFSKVYLLLRCQIVCCKVLHSAFPWLIHAQTSKLNSSISAVGQSRGSGGDFISFWLGWEHLGVLGVGWGFPLSPLVGTQSLVESS